MNSSRVRAVRTTAIALVACLGVFALTAGCTTDEPIGLADPYLGGRLAVDEVPRPKATGSVEIVWKGGRGHGVEPGMEKLALAELAAFPAQDGRPARGEFYYRVLNPDGTLHREIFATVTDVFIDAGNNKAKFLGEVVEDLRICAGGGDEGGCGCDGGGSEGHDGGCSDGSHDGGGCSDGGCSDGGDGGCSDGGCSDGGDSGGCSGGGDTGGCSDGAGSSGSGDGHDGACSGGGSGGGGQPGRLSRVGQKVAVKLHDGGTPAVAGDGIHWKWFDPNSTALPDMNDIESQKWRCLCKKTIIGGNLVVHPVPES